FVVIGETLPFAYLYLGGKWMLYKPLEGVIKAGQDIFGGDMDMESAAFHVIGGSLPFMIYTGGKAWKNSSSRGLGAVWNGVSAGVTSFPPVAAFGKNAKVGVKLRIEGILHESWTKAVLQKVIGGPRDIVNSMKYLGKKAAYLEAMGLSEESTMKSLKKNVNKLFKLEGGEELVKKALEGLGVVDTEIKSIFSSVKGGNTEVVDEVVRKFKYSGNNWHETQTGLYQDIAAVPGKVMGKKVEVSSDFLDKVKDIDALKTEVELSNFKETLKEIDRIELEVGKAKNMKDVKVTEYYTERLNNVEGNFKDRLQGNSLNKRLLVLEGELKTRFPQEFAKISSEKFLKSPWQYLDNIKGAAKVMAPIIGLLGLGMLFKGHVQAAEAGFFDESKGDPRSFIKSVINNHAVNLIAEAETQKRWTGQKELSLSTIIGDEESSMELIDAISSEQSIWGDSFASNSYQMADHNMDMSKVLADMPEDLRSTYELLKDQSITEASKSTGIARTTLSSRAKRLREYLDKLGLRE
ncbi:MAG: hypothetical protein COB76_03360, partial [Alphaproteobacteria bacterium]